MHSTLRMAAHVFTNFYRSGGSFLNRTEDVPWARMWKKSLSSYENEYNSKSIWGAVYINGQSVFRTKNDRFMDVIEQCALASKDDYDHTKDVAEYALQQLGKNIVITHYNNMAVSIADVPDLLKCGIVNRSNRGDVVFNFLMAGNSPRIDRISHAFYMAAAYIESINLAHMIKMCNNPELARMAGIGPNRSGRAKASRLRLLTLDEEIKRIEELYDVKYRPEKPMIFGL